MARGDMTEAVAEFVAHRDGYTCIAPRYGASSMDCMDPERYEHVNEGYGRMGRRAVSCPCSLAIVCSGHAEPGMRAGYVWATAKEGRAACRAHILSFGYGPHVNGHAALILARVPA